MLPYQFVTDLNRDKAKKNLKRLVLVQVESTEGKFAIQNLFHLS
jgi:hypothetical protein